MLQEIKDFINHSNSIKLLKSNRRRFIVVNTDIIDGDVEFVLSDQLESISLCHKWQTL